MTPLEAVILGIIQGLTEPLPVSSSAHLVLVPALIPGFQQPDVFFDVMLHLGTLFSVVFFLRREIAGLCLSLLPTGTKGDTMAKRKGKQADQRLLLLILLATVITGSIGLLFQARIEALFASPQIAAAMLLVTGGLLFLSDRVSKGQRQKADMTLSDGIVIGLVQALALIPGISRSGSTIAFGIFRGLERNTAARFSFLLSIPAIAGAVVLKVSELDGIALEALPTLAAGFLAAGVTGWIALNLLFTLINRSGLSPFAYYCWLAGVAMLLLLSCRS